MADPQHNVELYSLAKVNLKTTTDPQISIRNLVPGDADFLKDMVKHMLWIQDIEKPTDKESAKTAIEKIRAFNTDIVVLDDEAIMSSPTSLILRAAHNQGSTAQPVFKVFGAFEFWYIQDHVTDFGPVREAKVCFARSSDSEIIYDFHHKALEVILDFAFDKASKGGLQLDRLVFTSPKKENRFLNYLVRSKALRADLKRVEGLESLRERGEELYGLGVERSAWLEAKAKLH